MLLICVFEGDLLVYVTIPFLRFYGYYYYYYYGYLCQKWNVSSGSVHLWNSAKILFLGPHVCTRIWVCAIIGLLKKPWSICQSGWRGIWNVFLVICWVHWGPRTRILVLLLRRYYPGLDYSTFAAQATCRYLRASAVWKPSFMYGYPFYTTTMSLW